MENHERMKQALRAAGYSGRGADDYGMGQANVNMKEASAPAASDVELKEVTASTLPVELREASGRVIQPQRTTGQPLPGMAELEQRMTVALRDIRQSSTDGALTAVNRTQQPQKGAAALSESSTPTPAQRIAAALKSIQGGR